MNVLDRDSHFDAAQPRQPTVLLMSLNCNSFPHQARQIAPMTAEIDTEYTNYTQQEVMLLHLNR
jgi:hypothetical protein